MTKRSQWWVKERLPLKSVMLGLLHNVQYVLGLTHNLHSVVQLLSCGYDVVLEGCACSIVEWSSGETVVNVKITVNNIFPLRLMDAWLANVAAGKCNDAMMWYQWLGHLSHQSLKLLKSKEMVTRLPVIGELDSYDEWVFRKQAGSAFTYDAGRSRKASEPLQRVHMDICRPIHIESIRGNRFFLLLVDDYTHMAWVFFPRLKGEVFEKF